MIRARAAKFIRLLPLVFGSGCYSRSNVSPPVIQKVEQRRQSAPAATPSRYERATPLADRAAHYRRPFGPHAPWNVPVEGLPRHPESQKYATLLYEHAGIRPGVFHLSFGEYTYPVYRVGATTKAFPVELRRDWKSDLRGATIPWDARFVPNRGTDGQVILLEPETGREWDLWQVEFDGGKVSLGNGNLVPGSYWTREVGFAPSRGIGVPYLAMLVVPEEVARGRIEHALSMPIRNPSGEEYVAPATKLEHIRKGPGVPEGMRFALEISDAEIDAHLARLPAALPEAMRRLGRIVLVALRDYGWFITDTSGDAHFQFEAPESAAADWTALGVQPGVTPDPAKDWMTYPRKLIDGVMTPERIHALVPSDQYPAELRASPIEAQ